MNEFSFYTRTIYKKTQIAGLYKIGVLASTYTKDNKLLHGDCEVFRLNEYLPQLSLRTIKASPMQLLAIAESIENAPYVLGSNDCQTWLLRAVSKLERYRVGEKPLDEMVVGVETMSVIECASGEFFDTGIKPGSGGGNVVGVVAGGAAKSVNYAIKGVTRGGAACVDAATNAAGTVILGGYVVGATVGSVATSVASGTTKVVGSSFKQVGKGVAAGARIFGLGRRK